jgi:hypothetical protein
MKKSKRIHNTPLNELFLDASYEKSDTLKPNGLWYSLGNAWKSWCMENMPERIFDNDFEIHLHSSDNILIINSIQQAIEFQKKYAKHLYPSAPIVFVDWGKVVSDYAGIEIQNYHCFKSIIYNATMLWLYAWDCDSGCIWDLDHIKKVNLYERIPHS